MDKEKGSKEKKTKKKGIEVLGDKKEMQTMQTQMLLLQRESTETLNKVLNEITLLNSNLEKMGTAISSMQQNVPTANSSSILANLDADTMLNLLPVVRSLFKGTETGHAMYPMSQVPQPNPLSFLNNLDIDKVLEILPVVRSLFKDTETGHAMYPMSQVPQSNPLSFLNNLDIDKVLEILPVALSLYKTVGESEGKNENKE
ncbi:hypothetical protein [Peribacillus simplex]|uniref:hypothetical protein n=1 Tax=Peribacillus simplex TaxID=1478 RepID=UPI003D2A7742